MKSFTTIIRFTRNCLRVCVLRVCHFGESTVINLSGTEKEFSPPLADRNDIGIFVVAAFLGLCVPGIGAADWPTFRGNMQRTGFYAQGVGKPLAGPIWVDSLGCNVVSSSAVSGEFLYLGGRDGFLYCIHGRSGNLRWKKNLGGWLDSSPLIHGGMAIVGSFNERIWILNKATGDILQELPAGLQISSPAITDNGLLVTGLGFPQEGLGAYDWRLGKKAWDAPLGRMTYSSPAVSGNICVIATTDGKLHGIDLRQRNVCWTFQTQGSGFLSAPAIDRDNIYYAPGNYDPHVYALDLHNGQLLWKSGSTPIAKSAKMKAAAKNLIEPNRFFSLLRLSPEQRLAALLNLQRQGTAIPRVMVAADSMDVWSFYPYGDMKTSSVAVGPENVYVIQQELGFPKPRFSLIAYNKYSGEEAWFFAELRNSAPEAFCSSPVVAGGKVFFGWGEGKVYALDEKTGAKVWEDSLKGDILSSPAIANGILYFATLNGFVYAYDPFQTAQPTGFSDGTYCYPNPARSESRIQYYLEKPGEVEVRIFDGSERLVKIFRAPTLAAQTKGVFIWNISRVANGAYFALVKARHSDGTELRKILKIGVLK